MEVVVAAAAAAEEQQPLHKQLKSKKEFAKPRSTPRPRPKLA